MTPLSLSVPHRLAPLALAVGIAVATSGVGAANVPAIGAAAAAAPARPAPASRAPAATAADLMPAAPCGTVQVAPVVQIPVGKSTVIKPANAVSRILLGNPENAHAARPAPTTERTDAMGRLSQQARAPSNRPGVADVDVLLLGPNEVYLLGKTIGSTNVVMVDRSGTCTAFDVVVGMDTAGLQAAYTQLLPRETGLHVSTAFDAVVLSGVVSDSEALVRATDLANAFVRGQDAGDTGAAGTGAGRNPRIINMLEVAEPQQVVLEVKVAEVSKQLLDQFGIDFARATVNADGTMIRFLSGIFGGGTGLYGQIGGTTGAQVGGGVFGTGTGGNGSGVVSGQAGDITVGGGTTQFPIAAGRNATLAALNMQKTDGLVKVLAEPSVMALSGQSGSFLAGGKIFIPVVSDTGGSRTVTLEEKEFGVSVKFTPTVLGNGRINLKVHPEVSELNATGVTISSGGVATVLPTFTSRKADTTVQLMDGQSFVIGGLVKNNSTSNIKAFPFLGELPIIGALFRSTEFQTDRSELVFVITPRLAKPLPADYHLPTDSYTPPSRTELIFGGKLEGQPSDGQAQPGTGGPAASPAPAPAPEPAPAPANATPTPATPTEKQ